MTVYLDSLDDVTADPELVRRVPYSLAMYYLALPLACENGRASVAMAYPDNGKALAVLSDLLEVPVVPVRGSAQAIRAAIDRLHPHEALPVPRILAWSAAPARATAVSTVAHACGTALDASVTTLESAQMALDAVLTASRQGGYSLLVIHPPGDAVLSRLLHQAATSLVWVRGDHVRLQHILVIIRGHFSDEYVLDQVTPLAQRNHTAITLMPLTKPAGLNLPDLLGERRAAREHIRQCVAHLESAGTQGHLKFRQGDPETQILDELREGEYDLLAMAAERDGEFVACVLSEIDRCGAHPQRPILITKPLSPPASE